MAARALDQAALSSHEFQATQARQTSRPKPLALIVFLENVGHVAGLSLTQWT